eukprot:3653412-Rhodomonas_salina.2
MQCPVLDLAYCLRTRCMMPSVLCALSGTGVVYGGTDMAYGGPDVPYGDPDVEDGGTETAYGVSDMAYGAHQSGWKRRFFRAKPAQTARIEPRRSERERGRIGK